MAYIYVITNDINDKKYVGQTTHNIKKRLTEHVCDSRAKKNQNRPFYQAINQYGAEHFKIELLEECPDEEGFAREVYWIDRLGTYTNGYNATLGGAGTLHYDYKEIADLYLKLGYVKNVTDFVGCAPEVVKAACEQSGVKMKSQIEVGTSCFGKKVIMLDKKTKEELKAFDSCAEAAGYLINAGLTSSKISTLQRHIRSVARGERKSTGGYCWKYLEE